MCPKQIHEMENRHFYGLVLLIFDAYENSFEFYFHFIGII